MMLGNIYPKVIFSSSNHLCKPNNAHITLKNSLEQQRIARIVRIPFRFNI